MKKRIQQGVKIACENWDRGDMNFEPASWFIKDYANDPIITIAIARDTMNFYRTTGDLEKTMAVIMQMRHEEFIRSENKKTVRNTKNLTSGDDRGKGLFGKK